MSKRATYSEKERESARERLNAESNEERDISRTQCTPIHIRENLVKSCGSSQRQ